MKKELNYRLGKLKKKYPEVYRHQHEYGVGWIDGYMWGWADRSKKKKKGAP